MKKLLWGSLCFLIIVCLAYISYSRTYAIENKKDKLESSISQFGNNNLIFNNGIDIRQELNIDNKKYVLFTFGETMGYAELTKGLNNKYKIEFTTHGSGYFRDGIIKTNKGKYIILMGKNIDVKIAYAKVMYDRQEYIIMFPQQEYYLTSCEVPSETKGRHLDFNNIKLFNNKDIEITN